MVGEGKTVQEVIASFVASFWKGREGCKAWKGSMNSREVSKVSVRVSEEI